MSTPPPSSVTPEVVRRVVVLAPIARRTVRPIRGARFSADRLFGLGLGLLVGRGVGVVRAHRDLARAAGAPPPSPPRPSG